MTLAQIGAPNGAQIERIGGGSGQGSEREWKKTTSCLGDQMSKSAALAPCSPKRGYNYVIYGGGPEPVLSKS